MIDSFYIKWVHILEAKTTYKKQLTINHEIFYGKFFVEKILTHI